MITYSISEIFPSIQGEGLFIGKKVIFVRFAGCNLVCSFCDTPLSQKTKLENERMIASIVYECLEFMSDFKANTIVFTGGEPLLNDLAPLIEEFIRQGVDDFIIETNGTQSVSNLLPYCEFINLSISPKVARNEMGIKETDLFCPNKQEFIFRSVSLKLLYPYIPYCEPHLFDSYPANWRGIQLIIKKKDFYVSVKYEDLIIRNRLINDYKELIFTELNKYRAHWFISVQIHKFLRLA